VGYLHPAQVFFFAFVTVAMTASEGMLDVIMFGSRVYVWNSVGSVYRLFVLEVRARSGA
jgi:hypothetical protein